MSYAFHKVTFTGVGKLGRWADTPVLLKLIAMLGSSQTNIWIYQIYGI
jgi:hypothetical protein